MAPRWAVALVAFSIPIGSLGCVTAAIIAGEVRNACFQYPHRIVRLCNPTWPRAPTATVGTFSIPIGSLGCVTFFVVVVKPGEPLFQYPHRIVRLCNRQKTISARSSSLSFQYPHRIVRLCNSKCPLCGCTIYELSVSPSDR